MRKLSEEERDRLRRKIQEQRQQHQEIVRRTLREHDEQDMRLATTHRWDILSFRVIIRHLVETIPGLSFKSRLILGLLLSILLPLIILGISVVLRYIF